MRHCGNTIKRAHLLVPQHGLCNASGHVGNAILDIHQMLLGTFGFILDFSNSLLDRFDNCFRSLWVRLGQEIQASCTNQFLCSCRLVLIIRRRLHSITTRLLFLSVRIRDSSPGKLGRGSVVRGQNMYGREILASRNRGVGVERVVPLWSCFLLYRRHG